MTVLSSGLNRWPVFAALASALMLGAAHAFERFGGYEPCLLCLRQREAYWAALGLAAATLALARFWGGAMRLGSLALAGAFLVGGGIAAYHAGAEWGWWEGPAACAAAGSGDLSAASVAAVLGAAQAAPSCTEAPWRLAGLSMAGYNALASFGLAGLSLWAAGRRRGV